MITPETEPVFHLEIAGKAFTNWSEIEIEESLDGFAAVAFTAPFEPTEHAFRETFRPFSYPRVRLLIDDELQFTGLLMSVEPAVDETSSTVKVQCVALPAILCDCPIPASFDKRETSGLHLLQIAQELCAIYGFQAKFADGRSALVGSVGEFGSTALTDAQLEKARADLENRFDRVRIERDQPVHEFLCKLARQRGLVMTNDADGNLVFQKSVATGSAVVQLEEGLPPLVGVSAQFNPQEYYSEVTAVVPAGRGHKGASATVLNPHFSGLVRPMTIQCDDTKPADAPAAAAAQLGRMFGNAAAWDVELPTVRDRQGRLLRPNTTLTLKAPSAMIYGTHEFLVRSVTKRQDAESTTASLRLVLPGSFSGEIPVVLPWNEAL